MDAANEKVVYVGAKTAGTSLMERPVNRVRPWHRYWARMLDIFIFSLLLDELAVYILDFEDFSIWEKTLLSSGYLLAWIPVEAVFLSTWGTTVGKWLFHIQVRDEQGNILSFRQALNRGFNVCVRGMGCGIPLVSFLCLLSAHSKLGFEGTTSWDKDRYRVSHLPLALWRKLACIAVVAAYLFIAFGQKFHLF